MGLAGGVGADAAAAVAALFGATVFAYAASLRLTGFRLYTPLAISGAFRCIAHAARAAAAGHMELLALYGAANAAGFGISVAMVVCFLDIWLRNAGRAYFPPRAVRALCVALRCAVAVVIVMGPVLGAVAAGLMYGGGGAYARHGAAARAASAAGFLAVALAALALASVAAAAWAAAWLGGGAGRRQQAGALVTAAAAAAADGGGQAAEKKGAGKGNGSGALGVGASPGDEGGNSNGNSNGSSGSSSRRADGLVLVLLAAAALLSWSAAVRVAAVSNPALSLEPRLYFPLQVLPELLLAALWSLPTLAARVALGSSYGSWLASRRGVRRQQQGRQRPQCQRQREPERRGGRCWRRVNRGRA